jgi:23S rRNA pseudouridine1911/1915/1917 synthase
MEEPKIIFETDSFAVTDKPSGYITNDAETTKNQPTVQSWVRNRFNYPVFSLSELRNGIVHRLDKETSGILLIAKTEKSFYELQRQFKERIVKKVYTALIHGFLEPKEGKVAATVGRLPWNRRRFGIIPGGRDSVTKYKVVSSYIFPKCRLPYLNEYSLVEFYPETGRTHQIRIHAKFLGHPIVSDEFYAGRKTARNDRKWCPRLFLHASEISFNDPVSGEKVAYKSSLSEDLETSLQNLTKL